jgi:hypothetical protein
MRLLMDALLFLYLKFSITSGVKLEKLFVVYKVLKFQSTFLVKQFETHMK